MFLTLFIFLSVKQRITRTSVCVCVTWNLKTSEHSCTFQFITNLPLLMAFFYERLSAGGADVVRVGDEGVGQVEGRTRRHREMWQTQRRGGEMNKRAAFPPQQSDAVITDTTGTSWNSPSFFILGKITHLFSPLPRAACCDSAAVDTNMCLHGN